MRSRGEVVRGAGAGGRDVACSRGVGLRKRGSHERVACLFLSLSAQLHFDNFQSCEAVYG